MKKNNQKPKVKTVQKNSSSPQIVNPVRENRNINARLNFQKWLIPLAIVVSLVAYFNFRNALDNEFVNLDDDKYVINNQLLTSLSSERIKYFFTEPFDGNYHPLTMISLAMDYSVSQFQPSSYHRTNVIFHMFNSALVFVLLWLLLYKHFAKHAVWFAFGGALVFAVHTLHVESVSWVSERKDVLYSFFFIASLIGYSFYTYTNKWWWLVASLLLFVLSVLSKGMAVSLAISVVLIDMLMGRNLISRKVILEKIPFFVIAFIFGLVAIWAQQSKGYMHQIDTYTFGQRIVFASYGFNQYILKLFWPSPLSAIYPYPLQMGLDAVPKHFYAYVLLMVGWLALSIYLWFKNKHVLFSILFFAGNIVFVLQLIPVGGVIMSDRYSYIPSIGYTYLVAYVLAVLYTKFSNVVRVSAIAVLAIYLGVLASLTWKRNDVWQNSFSLWDDVLTQYPKTTSAWYNLAIAHYELKNYPLAIQAYDRAIEVAPNYVDAIYNRGNVKFYMNDIEGAHADFSLALQINPAYLSAAHNRSITFMKMGKYTEAENDCNLVLASNPQNVDALFNRGISRINLKKNTEAVQDFTLILQLAPQYHKAKLYRGLANARAGNTDLGCKEMKEAQTLGVSEAAEYISRYCK